MAKSRIERPKAFKKLASKGEKFLYEMRPISLVIISLYAIAFPTHQVMQFAGLVLLGCAAVITKLRLSHRGYLSF